jgi:hypothetical protein
MKLKWFIIFLLIGFWFYWFEWRPTEIKRECSKASTVFMVENNRSWELKDLMYETCLLNKGGI